MSCQKCLKLLTTEVTATELALLRTSYSTIRNTTASAVHTEQLKQCCPSKARTFIIETGQINKYIVIKLPGFSAFCISRLNTPKDKISYSSKNKYLMKIPSTIIIDNTRTLSQRSIWRIKPKGMYTRKV